MTRRRKIIVVLAGLILAILICIPLVQKLGIELMELQYRDRILSENETLGTIADSLALPAEKFAGPLGARNIAPERLRNLTLVEVARETGRPLPEVKQIVAEVGIGNQVGDAYGWTFWVPAKKDDHH